MRFYLLCASSPLYPGFLPALPINTTCNVFVTHFSPAGVPGARATWHSEVDDTVPGSPTPTLLLGVGSGPLGSGCCSSVRAPLSPAPAPAAAAESSLRSSSFAACGGACGSSGARRRGGDLAPCCARCKRPSTCTRRGGGGGGVGPPWCGVGTGCQVWAVLLEPEKQPAAQEDAEPVDDHHGDACRARGRPISRGGWGWARRCRRGAVPSIAARSLEAAISWSCERAARAERTRLMPEPTTGGRMEVAMATPTTVSESALVTYYTPT